MREIKVRGYAVDEMIDSQWVYGTGIHRTVFAEDFAKERGQSGETFVWTDRGWVLVQDESIGQYTGLKDKNGREIYEGDILEFKVMSQIERHCVEYSEYGEWCIGMYLLSTQFEKCEVVGNAYENSLTIK